MKTLSQILVLALLTLGSCTSSLYTGTEYDDLYYLPSDKPVVKDNSSVNEKIAEGTLKDKDYYDNKYATDTLVADQYNNAVDIGSQVYNNDFYNNQGYDYYDNYSSYAGRLSRFYGNYFDPYWRDPFYFSYGFPSFGYSFGFGGFPYSYGFGYPYYGYGGYYDYFGGYYPGYYGGYYGGFYGGYYGGYGSYYGSDFVTFRNHKVPYGRTTERPSNLSSRWNNNVSGIGSSGRSSYLSGNSRLSGRTTRSQTITTDQRRNVTSGVNSPQSGNQTGRRLNQDQNKKEYIRSNTSQQNQPDSKPEYNSTNRKYTPSYNNPRMSTRPSYNNSRVSQGSNSNGINNNGASNNSRMYNNSGTFRTPSNQGSYQNYNNSSVKSNSSNSYQRRSDSPSRYSSPAGQYRSGSYRSSSSYSVPSRNSVERSSGYSGSSSGSYRSSSSYSSGSSGGSYSSGSSSSHSSSGSSSGGSSSSGGGGRRH